MNLTIRPLGSGKIRTLHLAGSLSSNLEVTELRESINASVTDGASWIVLDCTDITFISSLGLGIVVASLTSLRNRGGDLCLSCVNSSVAQTLNASLLNTIIKLYDTTEEAVASFSSRGS